MPEVKLEALPFREAIKFFKDKEFVISPNGWRDVWAEQHAHAFTVARVTEMDVLEDIFKALRKAKEKGISQEKFKRDLIPLLTRKGWFAPELPVGEEGLKPLTPWRLDTIFRTNVQSAYMAGHYQQMLEAAHDLPYWQYIAVMDRRTRVTHAMMHGKIFRFDHPIWDHWHPPNGFNCRCTVRAFSEDQMRERGLKEQTVGVDLKPDEGFDYNVGRAAFKPDFNKYSPEGKRQLLRVTEPPKDMEALGGYLTRMKKGYLQTGMPASDKPVKITKLDDPRYNGVAWYGTGEISLSQSRVYPLIEKVLERGSLESAEEYSAMRTLNHEFGHLLGRETNHVRYAQQGPYYTIVQTVNDLHARYSLENTLRVLKIDYDWKKTQALIGLDPHTSYQIYVERAQAIFAAAGLDATEVKALAARLNLFEDTEKFSEIIWEELKAKRPGVVMPNVDFGEVLRDPALFNAVLPIFGG